MDTHRDKSRHQSATNENETVHEVKYSCIYIIVPVFDRFANVERLYKLLEPQTHQNFRLVLVDHGYQHLPEDSIPAFAIHLLGTPEQWWSGAINIGLRYVLHEANAQNDDFVVLQNDDVVFDANFLSDLVDSHRRTKAIVSAITLDADTGKILDANNRLSFWRAKHVCALKGLPLESIRSTFLEADVLKGRGTLYPLSVVREIGLTDEHLHYRADPEWSYRAKKLGWRLGVIPSISVLTRMDTQEGNRRKPGLSTFIDHLFSKRSTQNLPAAWRYFSLCYGTLPACYCIIVHSARSIIVAAKRAITG